MLSIGIVGLPNVGKSTLFNALTRTKQANAANYPFCTIEPNVGIVEVPDSRLGELARISKSQKIVPTAIQFVDIAGIVKGASEGEGLGNKFLSHIREVDAIAHVVRAFENNDIIHVHNKVDPKDDAEVINLELVLADMETVDKRLDTTRKKAKGAAAKEVVGELAVLERLQKHLAEGKPVRQILSEFSLEEAPIVRDLHLLTAKPMMYVVNVSHIGDPTPTLEEGIPHVAICASEESDLSGLSREEATSLLTEFGETVSGLDKVITAGYGLLNLITYFTSGEPETRAWTVTKETSAPDAAGVIHTDFIKGFVKADVIQWKLFVENNGWVGAKEKGLVKLVGKEYIVLDGDVCYFHIA